MHLKSGAGCVRLTRKETFVIFISIHVNNSEFFDIFFANQFDFDLWKVQLN